MTEREDQAAAPVTTGAGADEAVVRRLVVITGMSGSGKSLVHRCFEDLGYFCVDNLPSELIPKFAELQERSGPALSRVALTVDVREREFLAQFPAIYQEIKARGASAELLFLEADDATLVRRFSETRRPHPLAATGRTLLQGIAEERALLQPLRVLADVVLDSTDFTGPELRSHLFARYADPGKKKGLQVSVVSFAYRHGLPKEADLVFDVRFLPNPYYDAQLRPFCGRDAPIREYLQTQPEYGAFLSRLTSFLDFLLPAYEKEGKTYLTIAIGCTGGRHRSVAVTEHLHELLETRGVRPMKAHRDCDRPEPRHSEK